MCLMLLTGGKLLLARSKMLLPGKQYFARRKQVFSISSHPRTGPRKLPRASWTRSRGKSCLNRRETIARATRRKSSLIGFVELEPTTKRGGSYLHQETAADASLSQSQGRTTDQQGLQWHGRALNMCGQWPDAGMNSRPMQRVTGRDGRQENEQMPEANACFPEAKCCLPEATCCLPEAKCCLPEASCCSPEAKCCLPEATFCIPEQNVASRKQKYCLPEAKCRLLEVKLCLRKHDLKCQLLRR